MCTHMNPGIQAACTHACRGPCYEEAQAKEKAPWMGGRGCRGHEEQQREDKAGQKMYVELAAGQVLLQGARFRELGPHFWSAGPLALHGSRRDNHYRMVTSIVSPIYSFPTGGLGPLTKCR